jgi:redox-sensitive bicupin YhaK (pirin superfamily)
MEIRKIKKIVTGHQTQDGAGVHLTRVISQPDVYDFDPFLMLDAFDSYSPDDYIPGFPWHPHRGIETVTYLISGDIEHGDSLGNRGNILDGCCQWMTAGGGIIHQEMPQPVPHMLGVQLWVNLPQKDKMAIPKYRDIRSENIPEIRSEKYSVRLLSGYMDDTSGAIQGDYVPITFLDVQVAPEESFSMQTLPENTVFIYIVSGAGQFGTSEDFHVSRQALLFEKGDTFSVHAKNDPLRFLFFSGPPLGEPIAWGGPIVMNTRQELDTAFRELQEGTFIKTKRVTFG